MSVGVGKREAEEKKKGRSKQSGLILKGKNISCAICKNFPHLAFKLDPISELQKLLKNKVYNTFYSTTFNERQHDATHSTILEHARCLKQN